MMADIQAALAVILTAAAIYLTVARARTHRRLIKACKTLLNTSNQSKQNTDRLKHSFRETNEALEKLELTENQTFKPPGYPQPNTPDQDIPLDQDIEHRPEDNV